MSEPDNLTELRAAADTPTVHLHSSPATGDGFTPGTILGGRYRIVSLIGSGGMGAVYRGDDLRLGQPIAMKFLSRRTGELQERMLYDEVRIGRQIAHPNVCRLYDIAEVGGQIFITMEFVDGEDLASLLRRIGRLPAEKAASVARDVCAGVGAAHETGVIHRDLKPANIMIDGRGRARITDFGLAVADTARDHASAGTPAYMAPEQLAGERATMKSDIYSLGLVLYELFTGKRVFSGASVNELREQQRAANITRPSQLVPEIDPRIERTILLCLEPDPAARPDSVAALMHALPSFDALAAAVAAGETPSPAMVAAASKRGDLSVGVAWTILIAALIAAAAVPLLSARTNRMAEAGEIKPPQILLDRTRELLEGASLSGKPLDSASYYLPGPEGGNPVNFVYRQSPRPMTSDRLDRILTATDPPLTASGMVSVTMEGSGRLREMAIVPPQRESSPAAREPDFSVMFAQAEIDRSTLAPATPMWAAPVDSDAKRAWLVGGTQKRVEAASYHGRPVWFAVIEPSRIPSRMTVPPRPRGAVIASATIMVMLLILPAATMLLALRNLRRGQGDRRGATRVALTVFAIMMTAALLRAHHVPEFRAEWLMVTRIFIENTFWSAAMWMAYIAIEPLVRRRWPNMLISWSRILEGRWSDPMVGRDLLIGCAVGAVIALSAHATVLLGGEGLLTHVSSIGSLRYTLFFILFHIVEGIGRALFGAVLLLAIRAAVRRMDVAIAIAVVVGALGVADMPGGPDAMRVVWPLLASCVVFAILVRIGLVALVAAAFTVQLLRSQPLTSDLSSWYFGSSALVVGTISIVAIYGFWRSLAGRNPLPRLAVD